MKKKAFFRVGVILLLCFMLWLYIRGPGESPVIKNHTDGSICAVLGHPDDETMISGTLAMLAARGFDITVVYVTSGDDGADETGQGLHGDALGAAREKEALQALQAIGIKNPPVFLRFPDSHVPEQAEAVQQALSDHFHEITPQVVIGFGPDGITGNWDHRMSGFATDAAFDDTESGRLLLHMAITKSSLVYPNGIDVAKQAVNVRVNVANYAKQRTRAYDAHHTQFNRGSRFLYKTLVKTIPTEEFIIARHRDAGPWLERCFDVNDEMNNREDDKTEDSVSTSTD